MIASIIRWSVDRYLLVILLSLLLAAWGINALRAIPLDAVPDLSDVQVIIRTSWAGQSPQLVEDQVTYPLTSAMLGVPGAATVRGYSFLGDSFVYVLFEDGTDPYWARSRVLEYLSQAEKQLPEGAEAALGPDSSGVGWVYQYALIDRSGQHGLAELRSLQDWFLKYELQTLPGVAEVAPVGGMVKQYQVVVDPERLEQYQVPLTRVIKAIRRGNQEIGAAMIEMSEAEYFVRIEGYIESLDDILHLGPVGQGLTGNALFVRDVAVVREGPLQRRGVAELDGQGEVVGGIVLMRWDENALQTIAAVKQRLEALKPGLPDGVEIVEVYDRSGFIERSVATLSHRLVEEIIVVVLVCLVFLLHVRSALVIVLTLPVGILAAFLVMQAQGINANIMSLGGIAIAIGTMVDAAIVMVENAHRRIGSTAGVPADRVAAVREAATQVGPPLFFSLLIITLSFIPVFALEAQEGRLFHPLAYTKTYAMAAAAGLSITLVPALMAVLIRGRLRPENANRLNRGLVAVYQPVIQRVLNRPLLWSGVFCALFATVLFPVSQLGTEFMPEMDEGDLLYMPTTFPGLSIGKARELLQQTDRLILAVPEVERVFGKAGRAETATDPAPLTMFETTIKLKPREQWRDGMTLQGIRDELDRRVQVPGMVNAWLMPISARIDMLSTGVKTPLGIRVSGPDLEGIEALGRKIETVLRGLPGQASIIAERVTQGRYINVDVDRHAAAHKYLDMVDVQDMVSTAVGGHTITRTLEGRERYSVNVRYPREYRDSVEKLRVMPLITPRNKFPRLGEIAEIKIVDGPSMIKSENGRLASWIYIDPRDTDIVSYVTAAREAIAENVTIPENYSLAWSGRYEYLQRATQRLIQIVPMTLIIIFVLLYLSFENLIEPVLVLVSVPFALLGGLWGLYFFGIDLSVAAVIGLIALAGVATEFGVVMLVYLREALRSRQPQTAGELRAAVLEGTLQRVRPKSMTVAVIIGSMAPIVFGVGSGSEMMRAIAVPLLGGMLSAPLVSMLLIPALYYLFHRRRVEPENRS